MTNEPGKPEPAWQVHVTEDGHLVRDRIGPRVIVVGIRPDYEVEIDATGVGPVGDWAQREVDSEAARARYLADLLRRAEHLTDAALRVVPGALAFRVEGVNAGTGRAVLSCDVCAWHGYHVSRMIGGGVPVSGDDVRLEGNRVHFKYAGLDSLTAAAAAHKCPPRGQGRACPGAGGPWDQRGGVMMHRTHGLRRRDHRCHVKFREYQPL